LLNFIFEIFSAKKKRPKGTDLFGAHVKRLISRFTVFNSPAGYLFNVADKAIVSCQLTSLHSPSH
jgi:hypothetical protein